MKLPRIALVAAVLIIPLVSSCTAMRNPSLLKAGYEAENQESWISRNIPGMRTLSNLFPPPSEARTEWDEYQKRHQEIGRRTDRFPDL